MLGKDPMTDIPNQQHYQHHSSALASPPQSMVEELIPAGLPSAGGATKVSPVPTVWNIQWGASAWLIALHIGALYAPWCFTWSALGLTILSLDDWQLGNLSRFSPLVNTYRPSRTELA